MTKVRKELFIPVISPVLQKIIVKSFPRDGRIGMAAIKSGLYFNTQADAELFIKVFSEVSKMIRNNEGKYSHVAVEFIKQNLGAPIRRTIGKPKQKQKPVKNEKTNRRSKRLS